jgi:hypothetical protein
MLRTGRAFLYLLLAAVLFTAGCGSGGILRSVGYRGGLPPQSEPPLDSTRSADE